MAERFAGKYVIVTGAGSRKGIGRAIALGFAREGARVVAADIDAAGAEETAAAARALGCHCTAAACDVSVHAEVERTLAATPRVDVLVNNAGFVRFTPFLDLSEEAWDRHMAVNVKGYFLMGQGAARRMVAQGGGGKIVNVTSISAEFSGEEKVHYCVTKAAVKSLTQGMALELARHRINVNALAPGSIDTDIVSSGPIMKLVEREREKSSIPWGRMGNAEDLVGAALFLASPEAEYLTGATLTVDGGATAGSLLPEDCRSPTRS